VARGHLASGTEEAAPCDAPSAVDPWISKLYAPGRAPLSGSADTVRTRDFSGATGTPVTRNCPPLIVTKAEAATAVDIFAATLKELKQ